MKIRVTMKDPDTLDDAIGEAVRAEVSKLEGIGQAAREAEENHRTGELKKFAAKWFEYGEYVTIELDTEAGTAVVVPRK